MDKKVKNTENIHDGHRQRMRNRFIETGFSGFEQHQILEMLLFYACPRKDTNELAHILINRFGSIAGVLDAPFDELLQIKGITENSAVLFKMIPKCITVYYQDANKDECYNNTEKLINLFKNSFIGLNNEQFRLACFDNDLHLLSNNVIDDGSPSTATVNVRKIVEIAFKEKTSLVAIAHNHVTGLPLPSDEDLSATRSINGTLKSMGIILLDHIIVGVNQSLSLRDEAYINIFD